MSLQQTQPTADDRVGTHDGLGSGDHDQPYVFGRLPSSAVPFPFSTRQYVRLLLMRSRLGETSLASRKSTGQQPIRVAW
jgi:hypothetical protein